MKIEQLLLVIAILLLASILTSKISSRFGIPALLLFLAIGMLAGSEGLGRIYFNNAEQARTIGVVALAFILFAGGLDTQWTTVRPALKGALSLATLGVLLTTLLVGLFASLLLQCSWLEGLLIGAIISSTDAAAVFSVLRARKLPLRPYLTALLELESGCNDPMAIFLTIGITQLLSAPATSPFSLILLFVQQMGLGLLFGLLFGKLATLLVNRLKLAIEGLYPVLTVTLVCLTYGVTALLGGSGFLAVYLMGILLGDSQSKHNQALSDFHDGLAWLMQITLFLTLGLLVFPSHLLAVVGSGLLIALVLIFVARPVSILISLLGIRINAREKLFVAWGGLRGAVPIVLATFPLLAGVRDASLYFNLVFFIVLASVLLQGTTISFVARRLGITQE